MTNEPNWKPDTLGGFLRWAREKARMSGVDLGAKLGISHAAISNYERDLRTPDFATIEAIAAATGADWLIPMLENEGIIVKQWVVVTDRRTAWTDDPLGEMMRDVREGHGDPPSGWAAA